MTAPPLVGASLSQRLMAQRESITAITLVICQGWRGWGGEGGLTHSHAPTIFSHPPTSRPPPSLPPMLSIGWFQTVTCPLASRHQASVDHRREMAPIPDTPQKPQLHPVIREAQDPTGEAGWRGRTPCGLETQWD